MPSHRLMEMRAMRSMVLFLFGSLLAHGESFAQQAAWALGQEVNVRTSLSVPTPIRVNRNVDSVYELTPDIGAMSSANSSLVVHIPGRSPITLRSLKRRAHEHGTELRLIAGSGGAAEQRVEYAYFSVGDEDVAGTVRMHDAEWRIHPVGLGKHLLVKVPLSKLGNVTEHPPEAGSGKKHGAKAVRSTSKTLRTVRILPVFDTRVYSVLYNKAANQYAQSLITRLNMAVANSGLQHAVVFTASYPTFVTYGSGGVVTQLNWALSDSGIAQSRDTNNADLVILFTVSSDVLCGVAKALIPSVSEAFAVIAENNLCDYTFEHEVMHLLSADHDVDSETPSNLKAHAHGWAGEYEEEGDWHGSASILTYITQAAFPMTPTSSITRYHSFSSPAVLDGFDRPMGTTTTEDNVRAITDEVFRVSNFR